jgi:hypothetical protein
MRSAYISILFFALCSSFTSCKSQTGGSGTASKRSPATVEEAKAVIDLSSVALVSNAEPPTDRTLATLSYQAKIGVVAGYNFYKERFASEGWSEADAAYVTEESASGVFLKNGFKVSVTVMPGSSPGVANFTLLHNGNLDLGSLELAPNLTAVAVFPLTAMYNSPLSPPDLAEAARKKLLADGWVEYGFAGDSKYYKKNAIKLSVTCSSVPAQGGKTMLSLDSVLMSADLPCPPEISDPRYSDPLKRLSFEGKLSQDKILKFYQEELPKLSWKSSRTESVMIDDREVFTWRNQGNDLLTLSFWKGNDSFLRVYNEVQTAGELAEMNRKLDAQAAAFKAKQSAQ